MSTYFKAVRPEGTTFHDATFRWVPEDGDPTGTVVRHPSTSTEILPAHLLTTSTEVAERTGFRWPARLLTVTPGDDVHAATHHVKPHEAMSREWRVTGEIPAWNAFGPNGKAVTDFVGSVRERSTGKAIDARKAINAAWRSTAELGRVWALAWDVAREARRHAAADAAAAAAQRLVWGPYASAAVGLVLVDLLRPSDLDVLFAPFDATGTDLRKLGEDSGRRLRPARMKLAS